LSIAKQISRLAQHSAIYAISTAIQKLAGFILLPVYTNTAYIASRSEFSDYATIFAFTAFMHYFYAYGMDSALLRYFFIGERDRKTVFSTTFFVLIVSSLATTGVLLFFSESVANMLFGSGSYILFVQLAAATLFFDVLGNMPYLVLRAEEKPLQYTAFRVLRFALELGLNIYFVVFLRTGVIGIMYTILIASIVNFLVTLPVTLRYLRAVFDTELCKEMLAFALPFLPNGIAFTMIELIDRFIIPAVLDKDALGLYSANYKFGTILLLLVIAFRNAWQPFFLKVAKQENARSIYSRVLTYFCLGAGIIVIGGTFFINDLLTTEFAGRSFLGKAYWDATGLIPIILLSYLFFGMYVIFTPGFYIEKKSRYMVIFTGSGAAVNIIANLILLPKIGVFGAAWATVFSYATMALTIYIATQRIYPIPIEWGRVLKCFLLIAAAMMAHYLFPMALLWRIVLFVIVGIAFLGILERSERSAVKSVITKFF